jgi:hypothetical protein
VLRLPHLLPIPLQLVLNELPHLLPIPLQLVLNELPHLLPIPLQLLLKLPSQKVGVTVLLKVIKIPQKVYVSHAIPATNITTLLRHVKTINKSKAISLYQ